MCVLISVQVCSPLLECVTARERHQLSSSIALHPSLLRHGLSLSQKIAASAALAILQASKSLLSLPSSNAMTDACHVQPQTKLTELEQQALYPLSPPESFPRTHYK